MSDRVGEVAAAILRYLDEHPGVSDNVEGIKWWLGDPAVTAADVSAALERLIRRGSVERIQRATVTVFRGVVK